MTPRQHPKRTVWQPPPAKCPVQEMGKAGICNSPVVPGQPYCARHLRKRDVVRKSKHSVIRLATNDEGRND